MAAEAHDAGIVPVLVTAPSNHVPGHEPPRLALRHLRTVSELVPLHQQYVQLTRDAARESGAVLCDAAASFAALPPPAAKYFMADGIHFTPEGDQQLAEIVSRCIRDGGTPHGRASAPGAGLMAHRSARFNPHRT
jgi:hypothetical protein